MVIFLAGCRSYILYDSSLVMQAFLYLLIWRVLDTTSSDPYKPGLVIHLRGINPNLCYPQLLHHVMNFDLQLITSPIFDSKIHLSTKLGSNSQGEIRFQFVRLGLISDEINRMGFHLSGSLFQLFLFLWIFYYHTVSLRQNVVFVQPSGLTSMLGMISFLSSIVRFS